MGKVADYMYYMFSKAEQYRRLIVNQEKNVQDVSNDQDESADGDGEIPNDKDEKYWDCSEWVEQWSR